MGEKHACMLLEIKTKSFQGIYELWGDEDE